MQPTQYDHLFATIDSLSSRKIVELLGVDYWHTVVIDECHRLAANRFRNFAGAIEPVHLLGLTATPERADGVSIQGFFSPRPDRSPAVELRLWDALDMQLLTPFEYYACDDDTDFSDVPWTQPGEAQAIDAKVTGNTGRARLVVNEWTRLSGGPGRGKAIVFCVSVAHAEFMAKYLTASGIPAVAITGATPKSEQLRAPHRLSRGEIAAIVTVDLYNEGVDIPEVDTLLLLRPTQSPVLFQQQIGRGLRLLPGKDSCLILDFVGQHRTDFRFDLLLSSLTGLGRRALVEAVEKGFTDLAPGCHIHLQRQTQTQVLRSLRTITNQSWKRLMAEAQSFAALRKSQDLRLEDFVQEHGIALQEIYRKSGPSGWTTLLRRAGLLPGPEIEGEEAFSESFGRLLHLDDSNYLEDIRALAAGNKTVADERRLQMLSYQLLDRSGASGAVREKLREYPACADEIGQLSILLQTRSRLPRAALPEAEDLPFQLHGSYQIREILAGAGFYKKGSYTPFKAGVLPLKGRNLELLFVTLDKSEGFHPGIAFHDYALSPSRFHWQTQNTAGPDTPRAVATSRAVQTGGSTSSSSAVVRRSRTGRAGRFTSACPTISLAIAR